MRFGPHKLKPLHRFRPAATDINQVSAWVTMIRAASVARRRKRLGWWRPNVTSAVAIKDERSAADDALVLGYSSSVCRLIPYVVAGRSSWLSGASITATGFVIPRRSFSSDSNETTTGVDGATPSFDETMNKLFQDEKPLSDCAEVGSEAVSSLLGEAWNPTWYNLADQAVNVINEAHALTGYSYAFCIIGVTAAIRVMLTPLFVRSQQNASRMAHMQPEMTALKQKIDNLGTSVDQETQMKYGLQMRALFKKYNANPLNGLVLPLVQAPLFMSMFFGLRKMPDYFPNELATGGILWFPDLTLADPLYILPIGSALSFLIMIEIGKEQMMATNPAQGRIFVNVFRSMALVMIPVSTQFSSAILCYWITNNVISLAQSAALKNKDVRRRFGVWDPPKPVPGAPQPQNIVETVKEAAEKVQGKHVTEADRIRSHNDAIENKKRVAAVGRSGRAKRRAAAKSRRTNR